MQELLSLDSDGKQMNLSFTNLFTAGTFSHNLLAAVSPIVLLPGKELQSLFLYEHVKTLLVHEKLRNDDNCSEKIKYLLSRWNVQPFQH